MIRHVIKTIFWKKEVLPIFLVCLIACSVVVNLWWIVNNEFISGIDSHAHMLFSLEFYHAMIDIHEHSSTLASKAWDFLHLLITPMPYASIQYPNFVYFVTSLFYLVFGGSLVVGKASNIIYLCILIVSTYKLGKNLHSRLLGITSVFLLLMYPLVFQVFRQYGLDFPMTAIFTLAMLMLFKSDNFRNRRYSLLAGLSVGIGMLIKGQSVMLLCPSVICFLAGSSPNQDPETNRQKVLFNVSIFFAVSAAVGSLWWGSHIKEAIDAMTLHVRVYPGTVYTPYMMRLWNHLKNMAFCSMGIFLFLLFLPSLLVFINGRIRHKGGYIAWFLSPSVLFSTVFWITE
jgi:4-amino-4-deoxy-L-arabinose transferase-like glycosyltransferase